MTEKERVFARTVRAYYRRHGRHDLPWRKTTDPYRILVSEVMLQQTQVDRVIPKYKEFLRWFPTVRTLAHAPLGDVLRAWQGLGYNRRAKHLHEATKAVCREHACRMPRTFEGLVALPGVGHYTAGAVMVFAYNKPVPIIETNIRSVYLHHFFPRKENVNDADIYRYIDRTLDRAHAREWYWALMDYGVHIKHEHGNPNSRSHSYAKQSRFAGSDREIRGRVLRELAGGDRTMRTLLTRATDGPERGRRVLAGLVNDGLVVKRRGSYGLPN